MVQNIDHLFIFKSNIKALGDMLVIKPLLDIHPQIEQWSVDLDDEDHVLRVLSSKLNKKGIVDFVAICGYSCEELTD